MQNLKNMVHPKRLHIFIFVIKLFYGIILWNVHLFIHICLLWGDNQHWKSKKIYCIWVSEFYRVISLNFEIYSAFYIMFISCEQGLYEKPHATFYDILNKISRTKICRFSNHESHFVWLLCGVLLKFFYAGGVEAEWFLSRKLTFSLEQHVRRHYTFVQDTGKICLTTNQS